MIDLSTVRPGDFGLVRITGAVGFGIRLAQFLNGDGFEDYEHALLYLGHGQILEAEPGGARIVDVSEYDGRTVLWSHWPLTDAQRAGIVATGRTLVGTPYSFLDYASLALLHFHVRPRFVVDYVRDSGHQICSQLIDFCYMKNGVHLFTDDRFPGDVTPGDLRTRLFPPAGWHPTTA